MPLRRYAVCRSRAQISPPSMPTTLVRRATDCVLTLDADGRIASLNRTAGRLLGEAGGTPLTDLLAPGTDPSFRQAVLRVGETGRVAGPLDIELYTPLGRRWLSVTVHPDAGRTGGTVITGWDVTQVRRADREAERQAARLRLLFAVSAPSEAPFQEQARQALALTTQLLGLDIGILSRVEGDAYTVVTCHAPGVEMAPGDVFALGDTYCALTLAASDVVAFADVAQTEHAGHPCQDRFGLDAYIGFPVRVGDTLYGTLNFSAAAPSADPFTDADADLIRLLALWIGGAIERRDREAAFREQSERLEAVVREAPLILFAIDTEGAFLFCEGNGLESLGQQAGDFDGVNAFEAYADYPEIVANLRAVLTGTPGAWTAHINGSTFEVRARPSFGPTGDVVGLVGVSTDISRRIQADEARQEVENRFRALSSASFEAIAFSERGTIVDANPQFAELFGFSSIVDVLGLDAMDICTPDARALVTRMIGEGRPESYEAELVRADGSTFWAEIQGRMSELNGRVLRITALRDISARRDAEARTRFQADVLSQVSDAVVALDPAGCVIYWNAAAERLHGIDAAQALGQPLDDVLHYEVPGAPAAGAEAALRTAADTEGALLYVRPDGRHRYVAVSSSTLRGTTGQPEGLLAVVRDVTARREMALRLQHQATHDALTGLPNRTAFGNRIEAALADGRAFGVLFLDLDRFKGVNDTLGHDAGDRLLVAVAGRMRDAVAGDGLVARFGGDEFGIVAELPPEGVERLAGTVLDAIARPVDVGERTITPQASIGTVADASVYAAAETLLRDADTAMYEAKRAGRAQAAVFDPAMHASASLRFGLENDLRHAAERDQLRVVFQAIVDLHTGAVGGFEALLRWQHPEHGLVSPNQFIPIAEDIGIVSELDRWALHAACRAVGLWDSDVPLFLSVNCSDQAFVQRELADLVDAAAREGGLPPESLVLELTERALVDQGAAHRQIETLRARGVRLSIDDFGSGYSSLGLLHTLPVDGLKIDRSFVSELDTSASARAIVRAVASLSEELGLGTVAEGIETPGQLAVLREAGCRFGQGYLFAKPVPADLAAEQLRQPPWAPLFAAPHE